MLIRCGPAGEYLAPVRHLTSASCRCMGRLLAMIALGAVLCTGPPSPSGFWVARPEASRQQALVRLVLRYVYLSRRIE